MIAGTMHTGSRFAAIVVLALPALAPVSLPAQTAWFPAAAQEGLSSDLAARLAHIDVGIEQAKLLPAARVGVGEMRLRLETLGAEKLMALAPRFPDLKLPMTGQRHLDAMARLGLCTYHLEARYAAPGGADVDARLDAAMGPMALALSTMYLRHFYLADGGTDEKIKTYLDGDAVNAVAFAVQKEPALMQYTARECRAAVSALLD